MSHLAFEDLVAYFAGDHPDEASVEEHLFGCAACTAEGARVAAVTETIRSIISAVVNAATVARLRERGLRIRENPVARGTRNEVDFPRDLDLLIHRLGGLDLENAKRVDVRVSVESSGAELTEVLDAPFDREAGAILIACQRHFVVFPPDTVMDVVVHRADGEERVRYPVLHHFAV